MLTATLASMAARIEGHPQLEGYEAVQMVGQPALHWRPDGHIAIWLCKMAPAWIARFKPWPTAPVAQ
jgi:hypothetical protein